LCKITCLLSITTSNSHLFISIYPFSAPLLSPAPLWIVILPLALLWIVVFLLQQSSPPMCPSTLFMLPKVLLHSFLFL
jgi:hypothetical protein